MPKNKMKFTACYEVNAKFVDSLELGFFADIMREEDGSKLTFVRVENGEPDAHHGFLLIDLNSGRIKFGYDILYFDNAYRDFREENGEYSLSSQFKDLEFTLFIKKKSSLQ